MVLDFASAQSSELQFFLPFFFVFAVTFALLSSVGKSAKIEAFGKTPINVIISVVFGFLAASNTEFVSFFFRNGPLVVKIFIGLFILAFVLQMFGLKAGEGKIKKAAKENSQVVIVLGGLALLVLALLYSFRHAIDIPFIGSTNFFLAAGLLFIITMFIHAYTLGAGKEK